MQFQEEIALKLGGAQIAGRVVDESGKPVNDFVISINYWGADSTKGYSSSLHTWSENGSFLLSGLVPGQARISIYSYTASGRMEFSQNLVIDNDQKINLRPVLKLQ
jgi:hypothetical protein